MSADSDSTIAARLLLQRHLEAINPHTCGRGAEPDVHEEHDDAMAWSLYGRGFTLLFRSGGQRRFRTAAETCLQRLMELRSPIDDARHTAWGLPYPWKEQPAHHPYGITTAMCGDFLLEADSAGLGLDESAIEGAATWLIQGLAWQNRESQSCPEFSPRMQFLATNVAARTAGFLLATSRHRSIPRALRHDAHCFGQRALLYTLEEMRPPGYWYYGRRAIDIDPKPKVDNLHTAYVIEGLLRARSSLGKWRAPRMTSRISNAVRSGMRFYLDQHFSRLPAFERVFVVTNDRLKQWRKQRPDWTHLSTGEESTWFDPLETRAWAIGAALSAAADAAGHECLSASALDDLFPFAAALEAEPGRFGYRTNDPSIYVRHEAHLFFGLCCMIACRNAAREL